MCSPGSCLIRLGNMHLTNPYLTFRAMDHSIFVGDLAVDVTDLSLQEEFRKYFPSVRGAKVIHPCIGPQSCACIACPAICLAQA